MTGSAVTVSGLQVAYGETLALDDVNLELKPGKIHGLVGMNGSGKSTFFKSVMGLVSPDRGTIHIYGESPAVARRSSRLAYTPQSESIDWSFPIRVADVVLTGRYGRMGLTRRASSDDRIATESALARVGLQDLGERQIGELSGGQRKRVFIARSLAQGADLLLLDEPFAGVDKRSEATIAGLLRELAAEGKTILISTHDLVAIPELCDDVALINQRIVFHGPTDEAMQPKRLSLAFGGFVPYEGAPAEAHAGNGR